MESKHWIPMDATAQVQLDIPLAREPEALDLKLVRRQPSLAKAIALCVSVSGFEKEKQVYSALGIDASHWTRIKNGDAHFPVDKLEQLMDLCGNEAPLVWLADRRGYELTPKESTLERENRELKERLAQVQHEREVERRLMKELRT